MLAGQEASIDGPIVFDGFARARGDCGGSWRRVLTGRRGAVRSEREHGDPGAVAQPPAARAPQASKTKEKLMRTSVASVFALVALVALTAASPSFAQGSDEPQQGMPSQGPPPQSASPHGGSANQTGMHACMATYRKAIRQQVSAHMQQWQSANSGASQDAVSAERNHYKRVAAKPYRQQCRGQLNAQVQQH
jgi:hypothetical protein